jgi:hypothetical protein
MLYGLLEKRISILNKLGGISRAATHKTEWGGILTDEARNSIMADGLYIQLKEAEAILIHKESPRSPNGAKLLSYHKAAIVYYDKAFADKVKGLFSFSFEDFRKLNGLLLAEEKLYPGIRRDNPVFFDGTNAPDFVDIPLFMDMYIDYGREKTGCYRNGDLNIKDFLTFIANQICYFESVCPMEEGNSRVGRILTNYILISCGLPAVSIKGEEDDIKIYYSAVNEFKEQLGFTLNLPQSYHNIPAKLHDIKTEKMSGIFAELLSDSLDMYISAILVRENGYVLKPLSGIKTGLSILNLRKLAERGDFIAVKKGREWYTHEDFDLRTDKLRI